MPRKKLIDTNEIKIEKIDKDIVEKKDCLQVKLVFNKPLSEENMKVMREYFKISIAPDNKTITRAVKNSWKGLVMLMLSLTFSKYRDEISNKVSNINSSVKDFKLWVDSNYEHIARMTRKYDKTGQTIDLDRLRMESLPTTPVEEIIYFFNPDEQKRKSFIAEKEREDAECWENILTNLPPNFNFEQIAAPKVWGPCYVRGTYEPENIVGQLKGFCKLLEFDSNQSCVITQHSTQIPHIYEVRPAKYVPRK